jgi:hypothetical protein
MGTITAQSVTYDPRKPGIYVRTGLGLGAPADEFRLSAASTNTKAKRASIAVTRIKHKDFTPATATFPVREEALVTVNIQMPLSGSFTASEIDSLAIDISEFLTADRIVRLASGEN